MQTSTPQDFGKIRHELLARRASLRHRHERIQRDLQRCNDPLVADAPDRAIHDVVRLVHDVIRVDAHHR